MDVDLDVGVVEVDAVEVEVDAVDVDGFGVISFVCLLVAAE